MHMLLMAALILGVTALTLGLVGAVIGFAMIIGRRRSYREFEARREIRDGTRPRNGRFKL